MSRRLHWLEDYAARTRRRDATTAIPSGLRTGIDLVGLSFRYPRTEPFVLRDVDLHFPAGSTIALVGVNGAGKTTLVKLLTAMYNPTDGRILIDGIDLADFDPDEWRRHVAAGFQDFVRFELVAQHSVGVGDLARADDVAAVETALTRAGASSLIDQLSAGLRTPLGRSLSDGEEISGGQWQQLALGRAMMRDAPLLVVLDEPTANLDAATEHALFERYAEAARRAGRANGAVTILVSHRFSTVQMADVIVVIHDNGIAEVGSHAQLLDLDGIYADLYRTQAAAYQ
jgi:ATP-binding cassette subfamily B protein